MARPRNMIVVMQNKVYSTPASHLKAYLTSLAAGSPIMFDGKYLGTIDVVMSAVNSANAAAVLSSLFPTASVPATLATAPSPAPVSTNGVEVVESPPTEVTT